MSVDTVTLFFALLACLAALGSLVLVVSMVTGDRFGIVATIRPIALELAAAVAVTATAGSLYLSEIVGYEPCRLCWVQRGFMYPSAVLLVIALIINRGAGGSAPGWTARGLVAAAGALAAIGLPISAFHRYEQAHGGVGEFCDVANPCSLRWVEEFGVITVPVMAGLGFAAIATLAVILLMSPRSREDRGIDGNDPESTTSSTLEHYS